MENLNRRYYPVVGKCYTSRAKYGEGILALNVAIARLAKAKGLKVSEILDYLTPNIFKQDEERIRQYVDQRVESMSMEQLNSGKFLVFKDWDKNPITFK